MSIKITEDIQIFLNKFLLEYPNLDHLKNFKFEAWSFGNTKEMADDLGHLVLAGKKTATCSLLSAYRGFENEIPQVGVYSVLCDGEDKPLCIIFLTETSICKFKDISKQHAYEEGEGDRTLDYWKKVHRDFFSNYTDFTDESDLVCERFKVSFKP